MVPTREIEPAAFGPAVPPGTVLAEPAPRDEAGAPQQPADSSDQLHLQPLDVAGALRILIAEVRAELPLPDDGPFAASPLPQTVLPLPMLPQAVLQRVLQALPAPDSLEPAEWLASSMRTEDAARAALERGVAAVAAWRDVPPAVVAAAKETAAAVIAALTEDTSNPLWLRPEWLGLAPRLERYWRRRRRARRALDDPDPRWRDREER